MTLPADEERRIVLRERLRLLVIGHYIYGGFGALMSFFFVFPLIFMMIFMASIPESERNKPSSASPPSSYSFTSPTPSPTPVAAPPPKFVFGIFAAILGVFALGNLALSALTAYAGRCIEKRKHKVFIYIIAGISCLFIPYGTLLGVFTILVLGSPEAAGEFGVTSN